MSVYSRPPEKSTRTVALKVIGWVWATARIASAFAVTAGSSSEPDHTGIVPIYEVGERDGSCTSMKFSDGGNSTTW